MRATAARRRWWQLRRPHVARNGADGGVDGVVDQARAAHAGPYSYAERVLRPLRLAVGQLIFRFGDALVRASVIHSGKSYRRCHEYHAPTGASHQVRG